MPFISDLKHEMIAAINKIFLVDMELGKEVLNKVNAYCDHLEQQLNDAAKSNSKN
jgi:hypothetical protein